MPDIHEPHSDDDMVRLAKEMLVRKAKRSQSIQDSPDLQGMASPGLIDWLIDEKYLDNLGDVYDYCMQLLTNPVGQAELLQFDMNDRRALAKVISMIDPIAGQPMMRFLLSPPGQNQDGPAI